MITNNWFDYLDDPYIISGIWIGYSRFMFCGVTPWPICGFFWNVRSILRLRLSTFYLIMGRIQNDFWIQDLLFWIASAHSSNPTNIGCIILNVSQYVATMIKDKCFQFDDDRHRFPDSGSRLSLAAVTLALFGASSWNFVCVFELSFGTSDSILVMIWWHIF